MTRAPPPSLHIVLAVLGATACTSTAPSAEATTPSAAAPTTPASTPAPPPSAPPPPVEPAPPAAPIDRTDDGRCTPQPRVGDPCIRGQGWCIESWGEPGGHSSALWCRDGTWHREQEVNLPQ